MGCAGSGSIWARSRFTWRAPTGGTLSGRCEQARADGEHEKRCQDHLGDPDLERVADGRAHQEADIRRTSAGPQRHVGDGRRHGADGGHLGQRAALGSGADRPRAGRDAVLI